MAFSDRRSSFIVRDRQSGRRSSWLQAVHRDVSCCMQGVFNVLCEQPETVAAFLVPRIRTTVARQSASSYIRFLTPQRAIVRLLTAPFNLGRFFDLQGDAC